MLPVITPCDGVKDSKQRTMAVREYYNIEMLVKDEENARLLAAEAGAGGGMSSSRSVGARHRRIDSPYTLHACRALGIRNPNKELVGVPYAAFMKKEAGIDVPANFSPLPPPLLLSSSSSRPTKTAREQVPGLDSLDAQLATQTWEAREQQRQVHKSLLSVHALKSKIGHPGWVGTTCGGKFELCSHLLLYKMQ